MVYHTIRQCGSTDEEYVSGCVRSGRLHWEKDDGSQSPAYMKVRTREVEGTGLSSRTRTWQGLEINM